MLTLETPFPKIVDRWRDPITGLEVPKQLAANLRYRRQLLERAEADEAFQRTLYQAASQSVLWWVNTFVWTYRLKRVDENGVTYQVAPSKAHLPFITWSIQDGHILKIENAINVGYDLLTDKARDMGATWDHIMVLFHKWLFEDDRSFLLISRKEDCVDSPGRKGPNDLADPGTLFGKLDYLMKWLPDWQIPPCGRTKMHLINRANRSRIDGESSNASAGASDRRTAILLDEMALMAEGEAIKRSTRDVTACRFANSTPFGPGTAFSEWKLSGAVTIFDMPWWEHPEKGRGRYVVHDDETNTDKIRSPYYDQECLLRSPKEVAINLDRDHIGSGETYFDAPILASHRAQFVCKPIGAKYHITFKSQLSPKDLQTVIRANNLEAVEVRAIPNGPWRFWVPLVDGRPDQTKNYVFGIDISKGMGASNSVISAVCVETREKVAEWANANIPPYEFARIVIASAIWFGGSQRGQRPLVGWEDNGDCGIYFGKVLVRDLHYPNCYLDRYTGVRIRPQRGTKYGWHSSTEKKSALLGDYRQALARGTFINHSEEALAEAALYIYLSNEQIGPAVLREESAAARKTHGDRVIADALANMLLDRVRIQAPPAPQPPIGSFAERYKKWQEREKEQKRRRKWGWTPVSVG